MREIKFRAWDKVEKKWLYFNLYNVNLYQKELSNAVLDGLEFYLFTDLHDKNGKEIWEGDWFKSYWRVDPFIIIFFNGSFRGKYPKDDPEKGFHFDDYEAKNGKVIGDIYENPVRRGE